MQVDIIAVGNSKGIRIPKNLLKECGFEDSAEMEVRAGSIVLTPSHTARSQWENAFAYMAARGDDKLIDSAQNTRFDKDEWQW
ncbi:MAG: AbrB/MazE/SpoVT family DNA-binding domain-containing protein [Alphaproteobacteria bacterium]|nr:AbrB/MazE/SpoVT family DNA-binding domain-containing protein [Alphaproteobacteria bacterium]